MPTATSVLTFLSSLGVNTHIDQGYDPNRYLAPLQYTGIRNIRDGDRNIAGALMLHQQAGTMTNVVGGSLPGQLSSARQLAAAGALLSLEGPNEPNNFTITYNGQTGGGSGSWVPVAEYQRDLYSQVKADPVLKAFPVFHVSEGGAEVDNVGMQFLTIPAGAGTVMPSGTQYADYANPHNYVAGHLSGNVDNIAWNAADPTLNSSWDGLYVEYGRTWLKGYPGYSNADLQNLPRVTSETGYDSTVNGEVVQGTILVNTYLSQFKRGWRYTFIYELVDDQGGASKQGLYHANFTPKLAATYIHNLTTVLAGGVSLTPTALNYSIANQPATVHDLLLQKSSTTYDLIIWGEQVSGSNAITVNLGATFQNISVFDTTLGTTAVKTYTNVSSIPLVVSNHAFIIELSNASATTVTYVPGPTVSLTTHTLVVYLSEDAYQGDALTQISLNGINVFSTSQAVTALRNSHQQQVFTINGNWTTPPKVGVSFLNDLWNGTPSTDRNLYIERATYDGVDVPSAPQALMSQGTVFFQP